MGNSFYCFFFTEFIEKRMSKGLGGSDSAIGRIADQLFNQIEELVISLREHLHEKIITFLKDFPFILGKSYQESSYEGFIAFTSYFVGVPNTLITSRMWLRLESAMKRGRPLSISSKMHPSDHMSICVEQFVDQKINSGARQHLEQIYEIFCYPGCSTFAEPKSQITNLFPLTSMF